MAVMPKPYPEEFRRDVVAVARRGEASLEQIAKDFGVSANSITNWLKKADIDEGVKPGVTTAEAVEIRELKRRNRLLEQEAEVMRRALAFFASREVGPK
jgi:transposase